MQRNWIIAVLAIGALVGEGAWILNYYYQPSRPVWPAPARGFSDERIDYSAPKYPDAKVATVPDIDLENPPEEPLAFEIPDVQTNHGMIFEGKVRHPNPKITAVIVAIKIKNKEPRKQGRSINGVAKGEEGKVAFHIEERATIPAGKYDVLIELKYGTTSHEPNLPKEKKFMTSVVAKGSLTVQ